MLTRANCERRGRSMNRTTRFGQRLLELEAHKEPMSHPAPATKVPAEVQASDPCHDTPTHLAVFMKAFPLTPQQQERKTLA